MNRTEDTPSPDARVLEILAGWRAAAEAGRPEAAEDLVARHPDLAEDLRAALAAAAFLEGVAMPGPAPAAPSSGAERILGDYRIRREIGRGGMGVVYEAEQVSMRRPVALKVLFPSVTLSARAVERFRREAQATGRLHHTHIVQVHGLGESDGQWYYAMELVRGRALSDVLADVRRLRGAPEVPGKVASSSALGLSTGTGRREEYARVARMFAGVAEALATAHDTGVIHRDVKPSNLMLDETATLKILDFGLASIQEAPSGLTRSGDLLGTPAYMSPEQARGEDVDGRTDVYSLGATVYEVLTLRPPAEGRDVAEVMRQVLARDPAPPRRLEPRIPRDLETIVVKALEKDRARRYASAAAFAKDLRAFADGLPIGARRVGPLGRAWRTARRHPGRAALVGALLLAVGSGIGLAVHARGLADERAEEARRRRDLEYEALVDRAFVGARVVGSDDGAGRATASILEKAIALAPERPEAWFARAIHVLRTEAENLADLDAAQERGLPKSQYRLARAILLRQALRVEDAREELRSAEGIPPEDVEALTLRAVLLALDGQVAAAEALLDEVLARESLRPATKRFARTTRGQLRARRGAYEAALRDALVTREETPPGIPLPGLSVLIAWLWKRLDRPQEAESLIQTTLEGFAAGKDPACYADLAAAAAGWREFGWAEQALEQGLSRFPEDLELRARRLTRLPAAEAFLEAERLLADDPTQALAWREKAEALVEMDRAREGLAVLDSLPASIRERSDVLFVRGEALEGMDRLDDARAVLEAALAKNPRHTGAALLLSRIAQRSDGPEAALRVIERIREHTRTDDFVEGYRAALLLLMGRRDDALEAARGGLRLARTPADATDFTLFVLTQVAPEEALAPLEERARRAPQDEEARAALAHALRILGRPTEALAVLDRPPTLPHTYTSLRERAWVLLDAHHWVEAIRVATDLLSLAPEEGSAHYIRGVSLAVLFRHPEAIPDLEAFLATVRTTPGLERRVLDPAGTRGFVLAARTPRSDIAWARAILGMSLDRTGDPVRARQELDEAIALAGEETAAWRRAAMRWWRAELQGRGGEGADAIPDLEEAVRLAPSNTKYAAALAQALRDAGRTAEVPAVYERLVATNPGDVRLRYRYAVALDFAGRLTEAAGAYEVAHRLAPADRVVRAGLAGALAAQGQVGAALAVAEREPRLPPADEHFVRMWVHAGLDRWEGVVAEAGAVLRDTPDDVHARFLRARALGSLGRLQEAIEAYAGHVALLDAGQGPASEDAKGDPHGLLLEPELDQVLDALADALVRAGRDGEAIPHLLRLVKSRPDDHALRGRLVFAASRAGDLPAADAILAEALAAVGHGRAPTEWSLLHAEILLLLDRLPESAAAAERAIEGGLTHPSARAIVALALTLGGAPSAETVASARSRAKEAMEGHPDSGWARVARGASEAAAGDWVSAARAFRQALDRPDVSQRLVLVLLARAYQHLDRPTDARESAEKALAVPSPRGLSPLLRRLLDELSRDLGEPPPGTGR